mgnify:FL=1
MFLLYLETVNKMRQVSITISEFSDIFDGSNSAMEGYTCRPMGESLTPVFGLTTTTKITIIIIIHNKDKIED